MKTRPSNRKQAENEILRLNQTLEERVRQRTIELSESKNRLGGIVEGAQIGIIVFDPYGAIESANPAAERIFGFLPRELVGRHIQQLIEAAPHAEQEFFWTTAVAARASAAPQEALGRRKDGAAIVLELSLIMSTSAGQQQLVAMVNDITERNRLEQELLEVGDRERQRLGNELHDGLGQQLHGIHFMTTFLRDTLRKESPARAQQADSLIKHLGTALELTRSLARGLQPVGNRAEDLMETLKELAHRTREMYRVDCRFICHTPVLVHRHSAANHLFRIAQEAVNNALKHGRPTRLRIELAQTPKKVLLSVSDNGRGIQPPRRSHLGLGLHIMQHRADAIHGSLTIKRLPQGGTEVTCVVARHHLKAMGDSPNRTRANCPRAFCVSAFPRSRMENDAPKTRLNNSLSRDWPTPPPQTAGCTGAVEKVVQWQL